MADPRSAVPNNLPIPLTSFIGREREIAEVSRQLSGTRLLTLTGAGGCGKSRLGIQVARSILKEFPDGVWVVELAARSDASLVPQAVASVLAVPEQPGHAVVDTVVDHVQSKSLLLLLDNCEHLLDGCADLTDILLRTCPHLRILATSREALGVPAETIWRVPSLSLPDASQLPSPDHLTQYEAVRLFAERAASVQSGFRITAGNAPPIAQVCTRLDGMPLAIELAAARVKALTAEQIAARLDDRFRLLTGGSRTALPRHRTLRAAMDWSYDLLTERERTVLNRLSVFAGGWTLEAAEAVCAGDDIEASEILDTMTSLVNKSIVNAETQGGEARYRLLETVRQYAGEKLLASGEAEATRSRHLETYLRLAESAEPNLEGPAQAALLHRLEAEHDNLRTALEWSLGQGLETGLRLAGALGKFWLIHGYFTEGFKWIKEALERVTGPSPAVRAKAINIGGHLAQRQGDFPAARALLDDALKMYQELRDQRGIADSTFNLGSWAANWGDNEAAYAFFKESLALYRQLGHRQGIASALAPLGHVAWHLGDFARARSLLDEAAALSRELGQRRSLALALWSLGLVAHDEDKFGEARSFYQDGLRAAGAVGDPFTTAFLLEALASLAATIGYPRRAMRLLGAAEAYRIAKHLPLPPAHRSDYERLLAMSRILLNEDEIAGLRAEGRTMTLQQAIDYASTPEEASSRPAGGTDRPTPDEQRDILTAREREVAALVAKGLTNREIASRLVVAERTAEGHVQNILNKLGFSSRSQIAAWAVEHGLHGVTPGSEVDPHHGT